MARAGFDPRASIELWSIMSEVEKEVEETGGAVNLIENVGLLRTHPTGEARLRVSFFSHASIAFALRDWSCV